MDLEMIPCKACNNLMPKLRLTKYGYKVCVNCSQVGMVKAITVTNGEGDNTWNDIKFVSDEEYNKYNDSRKNNEET